MEFDGGRADGGGRRTKQQERICYCRCCGFFSCSSCSFDGVIAGFVVVIVVQKVKEEVQGSIMVYIGVVMYKDESRGTVFSLLMYLEMLVFLA